MHVPLARSRRCLAGVSLLVVSVAAVGQAEAQEANVPGIVGGAIEGNAPGAAAAAMGYDYWGRSGFYPGERGAPYDERRIYGDPYGRPYYGQGYPSSSFQPEYGYGSAATRREGRTVYRPVLPNPPVSADAYRAIIINPKETQATLRFSVNNRWYDLEPGQQQEFSGRMPRP